MTACKRGDVVLVLFPNSDGVTYKKRPALVVQSDALRTELNNQLVACITKTPRQGVTRLAVVQATPEGKQMGLLLDSVIVVDNIATIKEREVDRVLGTCPDMERIDAMLRIAFDLPAVGTT